MYIESEGTDMSYFSYEVKVYSTEACAILESYQGIVTAEDYHEAMDQVMDFYGAEYLSSIRLEDWETEGTVLELTEQAIRDLRGDEVNG
jgi:hypothetical protein